MNHNDTNRRLQDLADWRSEHLRGGNGISGYESTRLDRPAALRVQPRNIELRGAGRSGISMVGYAAVFNTRSQPMGTPNNKFVEIIRPGAFTRSLAADEDIRAMWDHDTSIVLGRTTNGTLQLSEDDKGLRFQCDLPDTTAARDAVVSIERGDVNGMSFGFRCIRQQFGKDDSGMQLRELLDVSVWDISATSFPAYPGTSVEIRRAGAYRSQPDLIHRKLELCERMVAMDGVKANRWPEGTTLRNARRRLQLLGV